MQPMPVAQSPAVEQPLTHAPLVQFKNGEHEVRVPCGGAPLTGEQKPSRPETSHA